MLDAYAHRRLLAVCLGPILSSKNKAKSSSVALARCSSVVWACLPLSEEHKRTNCVHPALYLLVYVGGSYLVKIWQFYVYTGDGTPR